MLHKTLKAATTTTDRGEFEAIAATYAVDRTQERIIPGAFAKTIEQWQSSGKRIPLHWDHSGDAADIIGSVDPSSMKETTDGLYVKGQLDLEDSEVAKEAWRSMKNNAVALSFGFLSDTRKGEDGITELVNIDLFEISFTPSPANPDTRLLSLKNAAAVDELKGRWLAEDATPLVGVYEEHHSHGEVTIATETETSQDLPVEDGSDEEPVEAKSAPQDPLRKRSMELAIGFTREGMPRYEPEVEQVEERPSVAELRKRSFEAVLKIADL